MTTMWELLERVRAALSDTDRVELDDWLHHERDQTTASGEDDDT